jgi:hypothetical protein
VGLVAVLTSPHTWLVRGHFLPAVWTAQVNHFIIDENMLDVTLQFEKLLLRPKNYFV